MEKVQITTAPQIIKCSTIFDEWKWDRFVSSHGLEGAFLDEYYLGKTLCNVTSLDCKKLFTSLFSDAVSSGAVFLPSPYCHGDFMFEAVKRAVKRTSYVGRPVVDVWIAIEGRPQTRVAIINRDYARYARASFCRTNDKMFSFALSSKNTKELIRRTVVHANVALSHFFPVELECRAGEKAWFRNGKQHRDDGPAVEWLDGTKEWWVGGKRHREGAPATVTAEGREVWWVNGKRHRVDGPAVINKDDTVEWWLNGVEVNEQDV